MKLVTFARAMAPHSIGDTRLVSDEVARDLHAGDYLSASEPWPTKTDTAAPEKPKRPVLQPTRPAGKSLDKRMAE